MSIANCYGSRSPLGSFIIYACPVGELNKQIEKYFDLSRELYGANSAHKYMPHCTLTGFFNAKLDLIPVYLEALDRAYIEAKNNHFLEIEIEQLTFKENWYGLELQCDRLKQLIANFAQTETLAKYFDKLRLKDWLHLSLAYDFNSEHETQLKQLAIETIDIKANVNWELRFYQKNPDWSWKCLQSWAIN
ncbi:hypothetical protein [Waterburya agarophytonicola]|uniref:hypothetical protein n=1 Tax=Waterburya agarophytonicola TaxID=2886916 RepID=UPI001E3272D1|nr:hypothetical protein [Waterburya agarophytonicola]